MERIFIVWGFVSDLAVGVLGEEGIVVRWKYDQTYEGVCVRLHVYLVDAAQDYGEVADDALPLAAHHVFDFGGVVAWLAGRIGVENCEIRRRARGIGVRSVSHFPDVPVLLDDVGARG
jgi:hypothetical protein